MSVCHAALLVLTPKALQSSWVLKEATILAHRRARDSEFMLFPALLDGLTRTQLTAKDSPFSPLYLDAIQRVLGTDPADIAAAVLAQLANVAAPPTTPFARLKDALAVQLTAAAQNTGLERICAGITGKPVAWQDPLTRADGCARVVASAIVTGSTGRYTSLADLIGELMLAGLSKEAGRRVLNLASPLWVNPVSAAPLAEVAARNLAAAPGPAGQIESWSTAINGDHVPQFTAGMYLRRAYLPDGALPLSLHGGESERRLEDLIARLRDGVRTKPTLQGASDDKIDRFLAALTRPYFVLLPPPFPAEVLAALQTRYPKVTFIGQVEADRLAPGAIEGRVVPLVPAVDLDEELKALEAFNDATERIDVVV
jgi:hypothetical protein